MNILLVHGFWNRGSVFKSMEKRLLLAGHRCFAPTLHPRDGRLGIVDLAQKLSVYVSQNLPENRPFAVVAFSMGCLVTQTFLHSLSETRRVKAFFAISGPMKGTLTAWLYPGKGARDMRPGSEFLRQVSSQLRLPLPIPTYTYYTPLDLMIVPADSSRLSHARELQVLSLIHRAMLHNNRVTGDIISRIAEVEGPESRSMLKAE